MVHKVSEYLSKQLGSTVKVDSVDIKFIRTVEITNVYLSTQKGPKDTLLYVHKMETGLMLGRTLLDQIGSLTGVLSSESLIHLSTRIDRAV